MMNNKNSNTVAIKSLMDECYFPNRISAMTGLSKEEISRIEMQRDDAWNEEEELNRASYHSNQSNQWFL